MQVGGGFRRRRGQPPEGQPVGDDVEPVGWGGCALGQPLEAREHLWRVAGRGRRERDLRLLEGQVERPEPVSMGDRAANAVIQHGQALLPTPELRQRGRLEADEGTARGPVLSRRQEVQHLVRLLLHQQLPGLAFGQALPIFEGGKTARFLVHLNAELGREVGAPRAGEFLEDSCQRPLHTPDPALIDRRRVLAQSQAQVDLLGPFARLRRPLLVVPDGQLADRLCSVRLLGLEQPQHQQAEVRAVLERAVAGDRHQRDLTLELLEQRSGLVERADRQAAGHRQRL